MLSRFLRVPLEWITISFGGVFMDLICDSCRWQLIGSIMQSKLGMFRKASSGLHFLQLETAEYAYKGKLTQRVASLECQCYCEYPTILPYVTRAATRNSAAHLYIFCPLFHYNSQLTRLTVSFLDIPDLAALSRVSKQLASLTADPVLHQTRLRVVAPSRVRHSLFGKSPEGILLRPTIPELVHRGVIRGLHVERRLRMGAYLYSPHVSVSESSVSLVIFMLHHRLQSNTRIFCVFSRHKPRSRCLLTSALDCPRQPRSNYSITYTSYRTLSHRYSPSPAPSCPWSTN